MTARLAERVREHFGADAVGFPVFNGTAANVVGLRAMLRPWQGVICAESAHLNVDEGGAPEALAGIKLLTVPAPDGKLATELVERWMTRIGDEHVVQPGVVSITQSTELGTRYTVDEMAALADYAHAHGMLLHVDGARLANAAARSTPAWASSRRASGRTSSALAGPRSGCSGPRSSSSSTPRCRTRCPTSASSRCSSRPRCASCRRSSRLC